METGRHAYWFDRLQSASTRLTEKQQVGLINTTLTNIIGLAHQELAAFTLPQNKLATLAPEIMLKYASAEKKIDLYFNGGSTFGIYSEDQNEREERSQTFRQDFKSELEQVYSEKELKELLSLMKPGDEAFITQLLINRVHPLWRRIRNAYLPGMTSLVTRYYDRDGNFIRAEDSTYTLFDNDEDAVSQVERIILGKPRDE